MEDQLMESLRYPIGQFESPGEITPDQLADWIAQLEEIPVRFQGLVSPLSEEQLDTPYRPGGWTIRQVVHHLADSHLNSYIRFKWALTENTPVIKPYDEKAWAGLQDSLTAPIRLSLNQLKAVHAKWVYLLRELSSEELKNSFIHPDAQERTTLEENIGRYVWHGNHHYAHIENLLIRRGWL